MGAGVTGLSTALRLQERGLTVTIWCADPPEETTSAVAAAVWFPYLAFPADRVRAWSARTHEVLAELAHDPRSGVRTIEGVDLHREETGEPWWAEALPGGARAVARAELPPAFVSGWRFSAPLAETDVYLGYLVERFRKRGGRLERHRVTSLDEAGGLVVNCAGVWAGALAGDSSVVPVRGQVVVIENHGLETFLLEEAVPTYVVPRSHDCVLGGTAEPGEWSTDPDPEATADILRRCAELEPRVQAARVLEDKVGLRPARSEVRVERVGDVIHNYGHGGAGITLSWGCAEEAAALANG